jgi:hypothetical protein
VMEEELEVEERMSAGMGWRMVLDGISPSARMFPVRAIRKLGERRNQVWGGWGWAAARGVREGHRLKEKERLLEFCSGQACFVSFQIMPSARVAGGSTSRFSHCFLPGRTGRSLKP